MSATEEALKEIAFAFNDHAPITGCYRQPEFASRIRLNMRTTSDSKDQVHERRLVFACNSFEQSEHLTGRPSTILVFSLRHTRKGHTSVTRCHCQEQALLRHKLWLLGAMTLCCELGHQTLELIEHILSSKALAQSTTPSRICNPLGPRFSRDHHLSRP